MTTTSQLSHITTKPNNQPSNPCESTTAKFHPLVFIRNSSENVKKSFPITTHKNNSAKDPFNSKIQSTQQAKSPNKPSTHLKKKQEQVSKKI